MTRVDGKEARVVIQQAADDVDQVKRSSSPNRVDIHAQASLQGINYDRISVDGSRHQIRLQIITLRIIPTTREPRHGSSKAVFTRIGNQQRLSRFSGFMENVRPSPTHSYRIRIPSDKIFNL
jgi:hypothetical protein